MAERAVFLDRDDTIIDNDGYLGDPSKVKLLPGAASALAALRALGYRLIVVSNQSGVARGLFDETAVQAVNNEMGRLLKEKAGTHVDASYYCPYHPEAVVAAYRMDHDWRKPSPGMLKQAAVDFRLELSQCWMVGDMDRDIAAGAAAGCRTILLNNPDLERARASVQTVVPTFVCKTLADAARIIASEGINPPHVMQEPAAPPQAPRPAPAAAPPAASATPRAAVATPPPAPQVDISARAAQRPSTPALSAAPLGPPAIMAAAPIGMSVLEHKLDELVIQLRQQNRHAELRPDFSLGNMAALIVQFLALAMLGLGLVKLLTMKATFAVPADIEFAMLSGLQAIAWIAGAVVLQGIVVALILHTRHR